MSTTSTGPATDILCSELYARRGRLQQAIGHSSDATSLQRLLREVDAALERIARGDYGRCESCHEPIEPDRLLADPLVRMCLDHLTTAEQRALEDDLNLASRIQSGLLPPHDLRHSGWHTAYVYQPHGIVSGDYCDLVPARDGSLYFMLGDVSGKGVAAALLMSQLQAMLRTLIEVELPLAQIMERANRLFGESTLPMQYATLICGRAMCDGHVEIANAGHPAAVLLGPAASARVDATGLPMGMWSAQQFGVSHLDAGAGDTLVLCSDGLTESEDPGGRAYGFDRFVDVASRCLDRHASDLVASCLQDVTLFRSTAARVDDLTLMAIRRAG
jgi:sigma-B regulation protein RsbU (phosphoserine phosphatase)